MSKVILLNTNSYAAQVIFVASLGANPQFRHYDMEEPIVDVLKDTLRINDVETDESLFAPALDALTEHFRSSANRYALDPKAPRAELLWRNIGPVLRRNREVVITGIDRVEDMQWLAEKCASIGDVLRVKLLEEPDTKSALDAPDAWKSDGLPESEVDRTYLYESFGLDELDEMTKDLVSLGFALT